MDLRVRFAGGRFELVSSPTEPVPFDGGRTDFTPPCDPPAGGWAFEHGPGTSNEALEAAMAYAAAQRLRAR